MTNPSRATTDVEVGGPVTTFRVSRKGRRGDGRPWEINDVEKMVLVAGAVVLLLVTITGPLNAGDCCAPPKPADNRTCPVSGNPARTATVVWKGKRVALCCPCCVRQWEELSAEEKAESLEKSK